MAIPVYLPHATIGLRCSEVQGKVGNKVLYNEFLSIAASSLFRNQMEPTTDAQCGACSLTAWFEEDRIRALKHQFDASGPYTHVVLPELCSADVLAKARSEIIDNVVAKYKETDLFKVTAHMIQLLLSCPCFRAAHQMAYGTVSR